MVKIRIQDLEFEFNHPYDGVIRKIQEIGLDVCPPEVGPHLRLQDINQPKNTGYGIAMDPIKDNDWLIFDISRNWIGEYILGATTIESSLYTDVWYLDDELVFCL